MKNKYTIISALIIIVFTLAGCLKDSALVNVVTEENNGEKIIKYLESQGDFINSNEMPAVDSALDVYNHLADYEILDIRTSARFAAGHISGAKNILPANLLAAVQAIASDKIIIIVSQTGQAASYCAGLLRMADFRNVYALKFGMVSWNPDFRGDWPPSGTGGGKDYTNLIYERPAETSPLPAIQLDNSAADIPGKIRLRVNSLLSVSTGDPGASEFLISSGELNDIYNPIDSTYANTYVVCLGADGFYFLGPNGQLNNPGHPPHAVFYLQFNGYVSDLWSTKYLQTIPSAKNVVVYSKYGHSSAFVVAYLRLLGYSAKSLLYGASWRESLPANGSYNYPYVTGN